MSEITLPINPYEISRVRVRDYSDSEELAEIEVDLDSIEEGGFWITVPQEINGEDKEKLEVFISFEEGRSHLGRWEIVKGFP